MEKLVKEIIQIKKKVKDGRITRKETIIFLGKLLDKFDANVGHDPEIGYFKNIRANINLIKWEAKNKQAIKTLKYIRIQMVLDDMGLGDFSEEYIKDALGEV